MPTTLPQPVRIPLPMDFTYKWVNVYLFLGPEPTLVDCGLRTEASRAALVAALGGYGLSLGDIARVVVTHPHIDHIGLAAELAREGAEIWVSPLAEAVARDMVAEGHRQNEFLLGLMAQYGFPEADLHVMAGQLESMIALREDVPADRLVVFPMDTAIEMGGVRWEVLRARGHSNRQVCFYHPESRRIFGADMLLPRTPAPVVEQKLDEPGQRERGLPQQLTSYSQFLELEIEMVYPGHGEVFLKAERRIRKQIARIEQRKAECFGLVSDGISTLPGLLEKMYAHLPTQGRFSGVAILLGYLDLLEEEQRIRLEEGTGGVKVVPFR